METGDNYECTRSHSESTISNAYTTLKAESLYCVLRFLSYNAYQHVSMTTR